MPSTGLKRFGPTGAGQALGPLLCSPQGDAASGRTGAEFHLLPAVDAALDLCREELSGVIVARHVRPRRVVGAGGQITAVMIELLLTAACATRDTGRIRVVHVDARDEGERVRVGVSDNGLGVEARLRAHRVTAADHGPCPGRAIAARLAIADAIVRAHGSALRCVDRVPYGARFEFELHASLPPGSAPRAPGLIQGGTR